MESQPPNPESGLILKTFTYVSINLSFSPKEQASH